MSVSVGKTTTYNFRPVRDSDLDDIVDVSISAYDETATYRYRYPLARQYPEEFFAFTRARQADNLANVASGAYTSVVAEVPKANSDKGVVVAYSFWLVAGNHRTTSQASQTYAFANTARIEAQKRAREQAHKVWFLDAYGDQHDFLLNLAVRPDHQRRGIATALLRWGLAEATKRGVPVGLMATDEGAVVYQRLGFRDVGMRYVQVDGDDEKDKVRGMVYEGSGKVVKNGDGSGQ